MNNFTILCLVVMIVFLSSIAIMSPYDYTNKIEESSLRPIICEARTIRLSNYDMYCTNGDNYLFPLLSYTSMENPHYLYRVIIYE